MGPLWAPCRFLYGPHMGNLCRAHIGSATGFGMGPIWVKIWVQHGTHVGSTWGHYGHTYIRPTWVIHMGPTSEVQPGLAWVPYWLRYGSNMGPMLAQHWAIMDKQISDHCGQTHIGPLWTNVKVGWCY